MFDLFTSILRPFESAVSAVLVGAHTLVTAAGLDPDSGAAWTCAIVLLVLAVRAAILPLVVHQLRAARASARARPHLKALTEKYQGRSDIESLRAFRAESAAVRKEHGGGGMGCLPLLIQLPVLLALYRVLVAVAHHEPIGAMTPALVASADQAKVAGVSMGDTVSAAFTSGHPTAGIAIALLVAAAAALTYATQRWFVLPGMNLADLPEQVAGVQRLLPAISVVGILFSAGAIPAGVLVYWVATNAWSLAQQAVVNHWWPTPGSPADERRLERSRRRGGATSPA